MIDFEILVEMAQFAFCEGGDLGSLLDLVDFMVVAYGF